MSVALAMSTLSSRCTDSNSDSSGLACDSDREVHSFAKTQIKSSSDLLLAVPESRSYGTTVSGTVPLTALALPFTSPSRMVTGTGGVSWKR